MRSKSRRILRQIDDFRQDIHGFINTHPFYRDGMIHWFSPLSSVFVSNGLCLFNVSRQPRESSMDVISY
ncbi:MAG: hypothetical protein ABIJ35_00120, partial [Acidobacteriota bacterium]